MTGQELATEHDVHCLEDRYFWRLIVLASSCILRPCGQVDHKYSTIQGIQQHSTAFGYPVAFPGCSGSLSAGVRTDVVIVVGVWYLVPAYYPTVVTSATYQTLEQC